jgi:hypothetical protein
MIRPSSFGSDEFTSVASRGVSLMIADMIDTFVSPLKGVCPVASW